MYVCLYVCTRCDGRMSRASVSHAGRLGNLNITDSSPDPVGLSADSAGLSPYPAGSSPDPVRSSPDPAGSNPDPAGSNLDTVGLNPG